MRIVYFSPTFYDATNSGGSVVSKGNYSLLEKYLGCENIKLISKPSKNFSRGKFFHKLKILFANVLLISGNLTLGQFYQLKNVLRAEDCDEYWFDGSQYGRIARYLKLIKPNVKINIFFHNIEFDAQLIRARKISKLYYLTTLSDYINESLSLKYADKAIFLTNSDLEAVESRYKILCRKYRLPVVITVAPSTLKQNGCRNYILFVGAFFQPNLEAIEFIANNLSGRLPYKFVVVGKGLHVLSQKYRNCIGLEIYSDVPDLSVFYNEAICTIAPIYSGTGMKVKVAESLAFGCPVVGTKSAFIGYEEHIDGYVLREANTMDEFLSSLSENIDKNVYRDAYSLYVNNYSIVEGMKIIRSILES